MCFAAAHLRPRTNQVVLNGFACMRTHRHQALLGTFTGHGQNIWAISNIIYHQIKKLGDTRTSAIEHFQQRFIPNIYRRGILPVGTASMSAVTSSTVNVSGRCFAGLGGATSAATSTLMSPSDNANL